MPSAPASQLSIAYGLQGPTLATATACASAAHALGLAFHFIRSGMLDLALAGGTEASLVPGMVKAWEGLRVLSADTCRPFSRDRSGLVMGEGAAVLVLEEWRQALRRGAQPLAEVVGFGMGADAADITAPSPEGAARAMRAALADAALPAQQVGYVNAHGTGTRLNDRCEAQALDQVFGTALPSIPVSSCKGQLGHTLNAAGALEALASVLALRDGLLPPTANFRLADPDCAPVDCIPNLARPQQVEVAMSNSFAFGGLNAVLVLRRAHLWAVPTCSASARPRRDTTCTRPSSTMRAS
jgi:nodulation protein E